MSRIGKQPIEVPKGVEVVFKDGELKVKGPKGSLTRKVHPFIGVSLQGTQLLVQPKPGERNSGQFHGLTRTLAANMVHGVTTGFTKSLTLIGVGYRASMQDKELNLTLGFSHPVKFVAPAGVTLAVDKQTTVIVSGADKEVVGQVAADIRKFRPPEPYHGKGVRYSDEVIVTKVGKSGGK